MTLYKWSQTASADATADSTINWAEGQAPSSINDSARAMMAATAKYRDDIAGAIVTAGTATAYTVASYEVFDTLTHLNGQVVAFTPHATNTATVTLNVDSLGARPLRTAPNTELLAGTLIQGTPYVAVYNHADGAFYLQGFYGNPYNVPLGGGLPFFGSNAPNSCFAFPYGQPISRTAYGPLFALIGTAYGPGDGSTTFNLPDLRGRVLAGRDDMGGNAASRLTSSWFGASAATLGATGGSEKNALNSLNQVPQFTPSVSAYNLTYGVQGDYYAAGSITLTGAAVGVNNGGLNQLAVAGSIAFSSIGSSAPSSFAICQPTIISNYIIRVT
jgi:microcystin-dependent protein